METAYTTEQESFRASLRRFLEDHGGPRLARTQWHETAPLSADAWQALAALGVTGLLVPESAGGVGGNMADMGVVMEELGRAVHPGALWSSAVGGSAAAAAFALDELLAELTAGKVTATLAVAEPERRFTGWRQPALKGGDSLRGGKVQIPDGLSADYLFVTADDGVYLVDASAPGLTLAAADCLDGTRRFADAQFDGVPAQRVGELTQLAPVVDRMLVALCADGLGAAQRALELTVAYAGERRQFGQPIGAFQAVQHLCAQMLQRLELGRAALHYALWALDGAAPAEGHRAAVICKAYMAEAFPQLGADAIQVFGGMGFTWEHDIQLYYKRLLSLQLCWGGAGEWLEELATLVIDGEAPPVVPD